MHARAAVEADPGEARHWHLLGLLLTASGDWRAAREVLEMGVSVGEAELADDDGEQIDGLPGDENALDAVQQVDLATPPRTNGAQVNGDAHPYGHLPPLLDRVCSELPQSELLLRPLGDRPSPNRSEAFEHALQLRMTQLTLTEFVKGPEGTGDDWVDVFQWFSERREVGVDDRTRSSAISWVLL